MDLSEGNSALAHHLPIILCVGMVGYSDEEYTHKIKTMKHPEVLVRFRDTMRLRALRQLNRGKFEVVSLCCR